MQPIPVGQACTDGQGSFGIAIAGSPGGGVATPELTTVCAFHTGQRAGTTFDFAPYGVQPIPVGQPCTDGRGSFGVSVAGARR